MQHSRTVTTKGPNLTALFHRTRQPGAPWRALLTFLLMGALQGLRAQEVLLDFDDLAAPSCAFSGAPRLTDQYLAQGVMFATPQPTFEGAIVQQSCFPRVTGHSAPNIVAWVPGLAVLPLQMSFSPSVERLSLLATNWNRVSTITLTAFDGADAVVGTDSISTMGMVGPLQLLEVAGGGIVRAEMSGTSEEVAIDDVRFLPETVVMEPVLYESADPSAVILAANAVATGPSPIAITPGTGNLLFYQVDDGAGFPAEIRLSVGVPGLIVTY